MKTLIKLWLLLMVCLLMCAMSGCRTTERVKVERDTLTRWEVRYDTLWKYRAVHDTTVREVCRIDTLYEREVTVIRQDTAGRELSRVTERERNRVTERHEGVSKKTEVTDTSKAVSVAKDSTYNAKSSEAKEVVKKKMPKWVYAVACLALAMLCIFLGYKIKK